ncbi:hypothetical protein Ae201684_004129 [Aphanomyces euteiches]|uniref:Uncharacterized protein n=1 Tax=Aphanomyces euteiches TaxID=100861 RepID=A0A6G0XJ60_9STRA|nr:hypothetical protein Ae201684_004129 [Aphanomyces euteiches]
MAKRSTQGRTAIRNLDLSVAKEKVDAFDNRRDNFASMAKIFFSRTRSIQKCGFSCSMAFQSCDISRIDGPPPR